MNKPQPTTYKKFSDKFLKIVIEGSKGEKINIVTFDAYEAIGLKDRAKGLLHKKNNDYYDGETVIKEITKRDRFGATWKEKESTHLDTVIKQIKYRLNETQLKNHPDKTKSADEVIKNSTIARSILLNETIRNKYDNHYEDIITVKASPKFKQAVKVRLQELSQKTDPSLGNLGKGGEDAGGKSDKEGLDVSGYVHLFPPKTFIDNKIDAQRSKAGVSRCANWIIRVYEILRGLEDELKGNEKAFFNKAGNWKTGGKRVINTSELGNLANFEKDIWQKQHLDDVNSYAELVKNKIKNIVYDNKAPKNARPYEDAQDSNIDILRSLSVDGLTWNDLSGPESEQYTEQFHFVSGYSHGERGIRGIEINEPNHLAYQTVINQAKLFLKIKKITKDKAAELEDLWNKEGGNVQANFYNPTEREIKDLGEIKKVYNGKYISYTATKFKKENDIIEVNNKINQAFRKLRDEINRLGSKPRNKGKGGGVGSGGSGNPKNEAIQEIKKALQETDLTEDKALLSSINKSAINTGNWESEFHWGSWKNQVEVWKKIILDVIYRLSARRKITQELGEKSLSIDVLKIGNGSKALIDHFKKKSGKSEINAERDRLLSIINNQGQNKDQEIQQAIAAVKSVLRDNNLEKDQAKIEAILGKNWEAPFKGMRDKLAIEKLKNQLIQKIKDSVAQNKSNFLDIIKEIEETLQKVGLSEKILGENWKTKFEGKSEVEINAERERLLKLIEEEINRQEREGEIGQGDAKNKKEAIVENRKEKSKKDIDKKLKEGHQKLNVKPDELPVSLFAPYKTCEEKINSLNSLEEISDFNNKLVAEINNKKEEKLKVIQEETITKIEKELGNSEIELGQNKDFKKQIRETKDPDVIELLEKNILALIGEQKANKEQDVQQLSDGPTVPPTNWLKVLGITSLIVIPLVLMGGLLIHYRRMKQRQKYKI